MAIHVQDSEADWLLREFAKRRGLGITAALVAAVREASAADTSEAERLRSRLRPVIDRVKSHRGEDDVR